MRDKIILIENLSALDAKNLLFFLKKFYKTMLLINLRIKKIIICFKYLNFKNGEFFLFSFS